MIDVTAVEQTERFGIVQDPLDYTRRNKVVLANGAQGLVGFELMRRVLESRLVPLRRDRLLGCGLLVGHRLGPGRTGRFGMRNIADDSELIQFFAGERVGLGRTGRFRFSWGGHDMQASESSL